MAHYPVMLNPVVKYMAPQNGDVLVDGTYGGGGYSRALLNEADCRVIGIDRDLDAITRAEEDARKQPRLIPLLGRFGNMDTLLREAGFGEVDGVVLDLGRILLSAR